MSGTLLAPATGRQLTWAGEPKRRSWTRAEYYRMLNCGLLTEDDRVELIDGEILMKWTAGPERRRWTCEEFERMGEAGIFGPEERVELLDGDVVEMSPQLSRHATAVTLATRTLTLLFTDRAVVRVQLPFRLFGRLAPEPDIAVAPGDVRDYLGSHPDTALLVIEISDSSLDYDQRIKSSQYASAGIPEYWILDLVNGRLEARQEPVPMPGEPFGSGYRSIRYYSPTETISPVKAPEVTISVADLLP
jgi:Uma2 family endonuclease